MLRRMSETGQLALTHWFASIQPNLRETHLINRPNCSLTLRWQNFTELNLQQHRERTKEIR